MGIFRAVLALVAVVAVSAPAQPVWAAEGLVDVVVSLKKAQFMSDKVGQEFAGLVSGVTAFGLFVELTDIFVEGLIHVSSIHDDFYTFEEKKHRLVGQRTGKTFTIGDPVRVRVEKVDLERKRVDFELVRDESARKSARETRVKNL